jgi:hypothetical protein
MFGDLTTRFHLLRLLMPRSRSQNVTGRGPAPDAAGRVILVAHLDAAKSGLIFRRRERSSRLAKRLRTLGGPIDLVFWLVVIALALAAARLPLGDSGVLTALQFAATVPLIAATILFVDVALSEVVPGASDNASGVAAVLEAARQLDARRPAHLDVWVVFSGAEEGHMLGIRAWIKGHEDELDRRRTFFVNVDSVGEGEVRAVSGEGFILLEQHDRRLLDLAVAAGAHPYVWRVGTDGVVPLLRGYSSITICATDANDRPPRLHSHDDTPERVDPGAVAAAAEVVVAIVRGIDERIIPAIAPSLAPPSGAGTRAGRQPG